MTLLWNILLVDIRYSKQKGNGFSEEAYRTTIDTQGSFVRKMHTSQCARHV